jgi:hypothetical protein
MRVPIEPRDLTFPLSTPQGCVPVEEPVLALCEPGPCGDNAECIINDSGEDCRCNPGFSGNPFQVPNLRPMVISVLWIAVTLMPIRIRIRIRILTLISNMSGNLNL